MRKTAYILTLLFSLTACTAYIPEGPEMLVIEGWIENGTAPIVFVTSSVSTTLQENDITDLMGHVAYNAEVTITHDGVTYTLTPTIKNEYFLKYCYTTNAFKGEIGGTYRLDVKWKDMQAQSVTTIPKPGTVDSIKVERHPLNDTLYIVKAHIKPDQDIRYYRFFSMDIGKDPIYAPSYLGTFDSEFNKDDFIDVNRGRSNPIDRFDYYYSSGDSVRFKLASIDSTSYDFWTKFEENVLFSHISLITYDNNIKGNIDGGLGYWFGYGVERYAIKIEN